MRDEDDNIFSGQGPLPDDLAQLRQRLSQLPLPPEPDRGGPRRRLWKLPVPPEPDWGVPRRRESNAPRRWLLAAAAAVLVAALGGGLLARDAWRVETLHGAPTLRGLAFAGRLGLGGTLATD